MKLIIKPLFSHLFPLLVAWGIFCAPLLAQKQLTFEYAFLGTTQFGENRDIFEINTQVFNKHAYQSNFCWQANEKEGNFGRLHFAKGTFSLLGFWAKRPWGEFEALIKGFRNGKVLYEKTILVSNEYQEFRFENWQNIDEITVESLQTYNQLYIDNMQYETAGIEKTGNSITIGTDDSLPVREIALQNTENQGIEEITVTKKDTTKDTIAEENVLIDTTKKHNSHQDFVAWNELEGLSSSSQKTLFYGGNKVQEEHDSTQKTLKEETQVIENKPVVKRLTSEEFNIVETRQPQAASWSFAIDRRMIKTMTIPKINFPQTITEGNPEGMTIVEIPEVKEVPNEIKNEVKTEITQVFKAPTDIQLSKNKILENANSQTVVGLLTASDADKGDRITFEILNSNTAFGIVENKLVVDKGNSLNASQKSREKIRVRAKDSHGLVFEKDFDISIVAVKKNLVLPPMNIEPVKEKIFNEPNFKLNIKTPKEVKVTIEVVSGPVMLLDDFSIQMINTGKAVLQVSTSASDQYVPTQQTIEFDVLKAKQAIKIEKIDDKLGTEEAFPLSARALSGLPITKWEIEGPAKLVGSNNLKVEDKTGKVTVRAIQVGNELYHPDTSTTSFWVKLRSQRIVFPEISRKNPDSPPFELAASSSSGLPVQFKIVKGKANLEDNLLTIKGIEEIVVQAFQQGSETFAPADPVTQTIKLDMSSIFKVADYPKEVRQGENIGVFFEAQKAFATDNQFTLVLSDKNGNFNDKKMLLGTVAAGKTMFEVKIPDNAEAGERYRLRIESSKPKTISEVTAVPINIMFKKSSQKIAQTVANENPKTDSKTDPKVEIKTEVRNNAAVKDGVNLKATLSKEKVRIEVGKTDIGWAVINIMSPSGRMVFQTKTKNVVNYTKEIPFKPTEKGVYWVKVIGEQDIFRTELMVK